MAHNLNFKNNKAAMMYYGEKPWHNLGTALDKPATAHEALAAAQLDYEVQKFPLLSTTNGRAGLISIPDKFCTMRTDSYQPLGIVGNDYEVVQNRDAFAFFDSLVGEGEAMYHTAGALGNGERIWILAKMPDFIKVNGADIVEKYVLLTTSHDGSAKIRAKLTPIRVVCENTLKAALGRGSDEVAIMHTPSVHSQLNEAHKLLGLTNELYKELDAVFHSMALRKITNDDLLAYVNKLLPDNPDAERNTRKQKQRDSIVELHETGAGAELARGTLWGAYNAVTEYVDHIAAYQKGIDNRAEYVLFGSGETLKQQAFTNAMEMMQN